jgi:hypothetical protein
MNDQLSTDLVVSAQIRIAAQQGIPITVVHRGDASSGTIILKINKLDGTFCVYTQIRLEDELVWSRAHAAATISENEADRYLEKQLSFDPDLWALEVEDRHGNLWFPGRIHDL